MQLAVNDKISQFEELLLQLPQVSTPVTHEFCDGLYARTMFIPAGVALTGAIHRSENFLFVRSGEISIITDEGMKMAAAGDLIKSGAGVKRAGFAHTDTIITTVHANPLNETDEETLWQMYVVPDDEALEFRKTLLIEVTL